MSFSVFSSKPLQPASPEEQGRGWMARLQRLWAKDSLRQGLLSVFDQGIVSATNFATSVIIGRLCSQTEMGIYALGLSIVYFARAIQEQLVSAPYTIYCNRQPEEDKAAYAGSSCLHFSWFAGLVIVSLLGFAGVLATQGTAPDLLRLSLVLVAALPLFLLREFIRHYTFSHLKMGTATILDASVSAIQIGTLVLLGWAGWMTVPVVFAVIGGSCLLASLGWFLTKSDRFEVSHKTAVRHWKHNWGFARWALACQLVGCSAPYVMPWFVASLEGAAATGILAASSTLVGLANMFVMGVANFLSPRAAKAYAEEGVRGLKTVMVFTSLVFVVFLGVFAVAMCFLGGFVAVLVYGENYAEAGPVMAVLAFGLLASGLSVTAGNGLWAIDRPDANFRADLCALVATIVFSALLIGPYGVVGAALATTLGAAVDGLIRGFILIHQMQREATHADLHPARESTLS
ncbi:MAG: lipopolysaccharide biosynthesis protein [Planctomycetaceae bacterium]|nr:lipopolysaccharide biosynthesis protein [Planctomycetaceae bacterium]